MPREDIGEVHKEMPDASFQGPVPEESRRDNLCKAGQMDLGIQNFTCRLVTDEFFGYWPLGTLVHAAWPQASLPSCILAA